MKTKFDLLKEEFRLQLKSEAPTIGEAVGISEEQFNVFQERMSSYMRRKGQPESKSQEIVYALEIANNLAEYSILLQHLTSVRCKLEAILDDPKKMVEMLLKK